MNKSCAEEAYGWQGIKKDGYGNVTDDAFPGHDNYQNGVIPNGSDTTIYCTNWDDGLPGSGFFTDKSTVDSCTHNGVLNSNELGEKLQTQPSNYGTNGGDYQHKPNCTAYDVDWSRLNNLKNNRTEKFCVGKDNKKNDKYITGNELYEKLTNPDGISPNNNGIKCAYGKVEANPQYGKGGGNQYYIDKDTFNAAREAGVFKVNPNKSFSETKGNLNRTNIPNDVNYANKMASKKNNVMAGESNKKVPTKNQINNYQVRNDPSKPYIAKPDSAYGYTNSNHRQNGKLSSANYFGNKMSPFSVNAPPKAQQPSKGNQPKEQQPSKGNPVTVGDHKVKIFNSPERQAESMAFIADYKGIVINEQKSNDMLKKAATKEFKQIDNVNDKQSIIIAEQLVITKDIDKKIKALDEKIEAFDKAATRQEQEDILYQMKALKTQIMDSKARIEGLTNERMAIIREIAENTKAVTKSLYKSKPLKAIEELQKEFPSMKDINANEMKYLAKSNFISREYSKYIGSDNEKFVDMALKQLDNIKSVLSKNKVAVEITTCENWSTKPIFENGTVLHPNKANSMIASAEKQIRAFKEKAESLNEYYPYTECNMQIYSLMDNGKLGIVSTTVDIGDGSQSDLKEHMEQICKDAAGKEKKEFLVHFTEAVKERVKKENSIALPPVNYVNLEQKYNLDRTNMGVQSRDSWDRQVSSRGFGKNDSSVTKEKADAKEDENSLKV